MQKKISGIVLAGGKSSRMGSDKGLLIYKESLLIEHSIRYLLPYCDEILISSQNSAYEALGYPLIHDQYENIGPLGGIHSALTHVKNDHILITACDIPDFPQDKLEQMCFRASEYDLCCLIMAPESIQPLPLLLGKKTLPIVLAQIDAGNYKLGDFILQCLKNKDLNSAQLRIDYLPKNINFTDDLKASS